MGKYTTLAVVVLMALALVVSACGPGAHVDTGHGIVAYSTYTPAPAFVTPTVEVLPTGTPPPTGTPISCAVKIGADNIRLRAAPTTGAVIVGRADAGTVQRVVEWRQGDVYLWASTGKGWFATRQTSWWVYGIEGATAVCVDVFGWPGGGLPPPEPVVRVHVGFKVTPGASYDALVAFADTLPDDVGAVAFVVQDTTLAARLYDTDIYTVFVPWSQFPGDCPNMSMSPAVSAAHRLRYVEGRVGGAPFDAVVVANECTFPDAAYYRDWLIAAVEGCNARGWVCIPHVHNTGSPPLEWLPALQPALCALERGGHYWGTNIYPYYVVPLMTRTADTQYTTWRHEVLQPLMACAPQWAVTELAPGDGSWPPDVADTAGYINATRGSFALVGVWYYGGDNTLPAWPAANWSRGEMVGLARAGLTP